MTGEDYSEARVTVWLSEQLKTQLKEQELGYEDSMSEWVRRAVQDRLLIENELEREGVTLPSDEREREKLLRDLLIAGIDATQEEAE